VLTEHRYFFEDPTAYDEDDVESGWTDQSAELLRALAEVYEGASTFDRDVVDQGMRDVAETHDVGLGAVIHPVRLAISGRTSGPGIFDLVAFMGRETTLRRIDAVIDALG
jgi:glutamyl-tRNA synthetase